MDFAPQQDNALQEVDRFMRDPSRQLFRLFGYAGTGKTTLARHFAEGVDGTVMFGAFTGKAAYVLRQKGCPGASTIHSMIYVSKDKSRKTLRELEDALMEAMHEIRSELPHDYPDKEGAVSKDRGVIELRRKIEEERKNLSRPSFTLNSESAVRDAKLLVIDECSMVDARMGEDLLSFGVKILVLGDPAQLPPVGGAGFFTETKPDVMLTDIHRQAADNPIIAMATRVRQGETLPLGDYGSSRVVLGNAVGPEDALAAGQILVGKNETRRASNRRVRSLRGYDGWQPTVGEKLVCLRNDHERGLLNGAIWYVDDPGVHEEERIFMTVRSEDEGGTVDVECHTHYFQGNEDKLAFYERKDAQEFDYGYAMTVHKAQGSQWNEVMLFDQSGVFRKDSARWLYTGITRAAEKLTVVRL